MAESFEEEPAEFSRADMGDKAASRSEKVNQDKSVVAI
jgi:hypothetical protein